MPTLSRLLVPLSKLDWGKKSTCTVGSKQRAGGLGKQAPFSGRITAINDRCDGLHGLCVVEWPDPGLENADRAGQGRVRTVSMEYIYSLLQEKEWGGGSGEGGGRKGLVSGA